MPIGGHPPGIDPGFLLVICASCRAGNHTGCRPVRRNRRLLMCECLGVILQDGLFAVLPCLGGAT